MKTNKVLLIGGGALAEQVIHAINNYDKESSVVGFLDDTVEIGDSRYGVPCIGSLKSIQEGQLLVEFNELFISIGYNYLEERKKIFDSLKAVYPFYTFIHPHSYIDVSARIGQGTFLSAGVHLEKEAVVGENVFIYNNSILSHNGLIKSHSFISASVSIAGHSVIGECCMLGIGSIIIDNISVTDFVKTGGGTLVIRDIMTSGTYVGNPAKLLRKHD